MKPIIISDEYVLELFNEVYFENCMMILTEFQNNTSLDKWEETYAHFDKLTHAPKWYTPEYHKMWARLITHSSVAIEWIHAPTEKLVGLHKALWEI